MVYAIGEKCWKSFDAGSTWTMTFDFNFTILTGYTEIFFIDANIAWIAARNGLYKTTNGGTTWQHISTAWFQDGSVFFTDANNGYLCDSTKFSRSADGGTNWNLQSNLSSHGFHDLHFVSATTGYIVDGKKILKTIDGGITWNTEVALGSREVGELHFTDANHGWACLNMSPAIVRYKK